MWSFKKWRATCPALAHWQRWRFGDVHEVFYQPPHWAWISPKVFTIVQRTTALLSTRRGEVSLFNCWVIEVFRVRQLVDNGYLFFVKRLFKNSSKRHSSDCVLGSDTQEIWLCSFYLHYCFIFHFSLTFLLIILNHTQAGKKRFEASRRSVLLRHSALQISLMYRASINSQGKLFSPMSKW